MEKVEEPTSKYVYKQQSNSPTTMEEQVESDMAPSTNVVNDIAKNLSIISSCHFRCGKGNILWHQTMDQVQRVSRNITFMQNINDIVNPLLFFQLNLQWKNGKHNHSENPSSLIVQTSSCFLKFMIKINLTLEYDENWTLIKMKT